MNNNKKKGIMFLICAIAFYAAALIYLLGDESTTFGIIWLCIGSTWLCLGVAGLNKSKKDDNENSDINKKE